MKELPSNYTSWLQVYVEANNYYKNNLKDVDEKSARIVFKSDFATPHSEFTIGELKFLAFDELIKTIKTPEFSVTELRFISSLLPTLDFNPHVEEVKEKIFHLIKAKRELEHLV